MALSHYKAEDCTLTVFPLFHVHPSPLLKCMSFIPPRFQNQNYLFEFHDGNATPATTYHSPQFTPISPFLHIYEESSTDRRMTVRDSDKTTPVYIVNFFDSKPHLRFCRPPTPSSALEIQIGSASFHKWHDTVDLEFGTYVISLESKGTSHGPLSSRVASAR